MTDGDGIRGYRLEVFRDEDGSWVAEVPELPGCVAASMDPQDLFALAEDAIAAWIEAAVDDGRAVPAPVADDEYSGRFVLRVPTGIHRRLAAQARRERVSLNTLCATALAASVGAAEALTATAVGGSGPPTTLTSPIDLAARQTAGQTRRRHGASQ